MLKWTVALLWAPLAACNHEDPVETGRDTGEPQVVVLDHGQTLSGDMVWDVDFDEAAEALGFTDCSYGRHYEGFEDRSAPWLCPDCEVPFRADVTMHEGWEACYQQIAEGDPEPSEWLGFGLGTLWRTVYGPYIAREQGAVTEVSGGVTTLNQPDAYPIEGGGTFAFHVTGSFTFGEREGDPMNGWYAADPYQCGWPKADPPAWEGPWRAEVGGTLPDGIFTAQCGDRVRLHDLLDGWLIVDVSAADCGPCQAMAEGEAEFLARVREKVDIHVATLLAPSLSDVLEPASTSMLMDWNNTYGLHEPVLQDRGYGVWVVGSMVGESFGYPTSLIVAPGGEIVDVHVGFGGWEDVEAVVLAGR
ncbi:MAG: hypothetical protein JXX28_13320 [Deltaproteobacteria bacterium]|nr:hypothetical protein [Deltaproteobacteria bacterium]